MEGVGVLRLRSEARFAPLTAPLRMTRMDGVRNTPISFVIPSEVEEPLRPAMRCGCWGPFGSAQMTRVALRFATSRSSPPLKLFATVRFDHRRLATGCFPPPFVRRRVLLSLSEFSLNAIRFNYLRGKWGASGPGPPVRVVSCFRKGRGAAARSAQAQDAALGLSS